MPEGFFVFFYHIFTVIIIYTYIYIPQHLYRYTYICVHIYTYIYICMIFFVHSSVCVHKTSRSNKPSVQTFVCVCVCVFCAWVLQCYTVCVCVCVNHISIINHESSNSSWWLSAQSSVTHTSQVVQSARITCFRGNPIPFPSSGGSNKSGKTERLTEARPTCIPDGRRVAAYVCVNLACTSSIILQSRNTADAHPLIIRSPIWRMP